MQAAAVPVLLELSCAARRAREHLCRRDRERLDGAVREVLLAAQAGSLPLADASEAEVLERLRAAVRLAADRRVDWGQVVAIVNREG